MILAHLDYVKAACQREEMIMIRFVTPSLAQTFKIFTRFSFMAVKLIFFLPQNPLNLPTGPLHSSVDFREQM